MTRLRRWLFDRMDVGDLFEYFYFKGITLDLKLEKRHTIYYARNSRLYKHITDTSPEGPKGKGGE